ncbi:hypothetical protein N7492_007886 [Penicillium capsulatum]|uniref:Uncharacterized protein n=1 Tax=Penicillium capsulatum TaxID=69766 RepID=A0A9W9I0Q7_9EURO|nr:hypothetical protein N7492_007886 [Penicillium capsulatum]KAJ6117717.1 hypothetical protein N7512_007442 [Penicillium capsulatum]
MRFNALIRTHHITSRKKIAALKRAADMHDCFVLLRSGGCPGIMYVEARDKPRVDAWVAEVRRLRYKDFQLTTRPGELSPETEIKPCNHGGGLSEVESVKEFGGFMAQRGLTSWWRRGMGYA